MAGQILWLIVSMIQENRMAYRSCINWSHCIILCSIFKRTVYINIVDIICLICKCLSELVRWHTQQLCNLFKLAWPPFLPYVVLSCLLPSCFAITAMITLLFLLSWPCFISFHFCSSMCTFTTNFADTSITSALTNWVLLIKKMAESSINMEVKCLDLNPSVCIAMWTCFTKWPMARGL